MPKTRLFWIAFWVIGLIALDQWSKSYVESHLAFAERVPILPFFDFTLLYNTGVAFSIGAEAGGWQRWFFMALSLGVSLVLVYLLRKASKLSTLSLSLILAGAVGNLIDRVLHGHVIDFLLFYWEPWQFYFPAFNVADTCICIGAFVLILEELISKKARS